MVHFTFEQYCQVILMQVFVWFNVAMKIPTAFFKMEVTVSEDCDFHFLILFTHWFHYNS